MRVLADALSVAAQSGAPSWLPAASAILGALVGGFASYLSNTALDRRRRLAEDARWRKENVYLPLRDELLVLLEPPQGRGAHLRRDGHLMWGISFDEPPRSDEKFPSRAVHLYLWRRFKRELRAGSYATEEVRKRLDAVDETAQRFNAEREENLPRLERAGAEVIAELSLGAASSKLARG